jgi:hypothetical protein
MAGTRHTTARKRKRSCVQKKPLPDRATAERYAAKRIAGGAAPWAVEVYRCRRFCGQWHVGHRSDPRDVHRR